MTEKDHGQKFAKTVAQKVIKYSKIQVRVIGSHGSEVHQGQGKQPDVSLDSEGTTTASQAVQQSTQPTNQIPADHTDIYSRYKAVKRGLNHLLYGKSKTANSRTTYEHV